jgi:hypothetical protein
MSIPKINDYPVDPGIPGNNKWKAAEYYLLSAKSELFTRASVVIIDKQVTDMANEAIVYLLQGMIKEIEGLDDQRVSDLSLEDLANINLWNGYLDTDIRVDYSIEKGFKNASQIINGFHEEKSLTISKNGIPTTAVDLEFFEERYLLSVTCFADCWNYDEYLFETWTNWIFFSWCTGA